MNQRLQHAFENEPVPRDLEARLRAGEERAGLRASWLADCAGGRGSAGRRGRTVAVHDAQAP